MWLSMDSTKVLIIPIISVCNLYRCSFYFRFCSENKSKVNDNNMSNEALEGSTAATYWPILWLLLTNLYSCLNRCRHILTHNNLIVIFPCYRQWLRIMTFFSDFVFCLLCFASFCSIFDFFFLFYNYCRRFILYL